MHPHRQHSWSNQLERRPTFQMRQVRGVIDVRDVEFSYPAAPDKVGPLGVHLEIAVYI